MLLRIIGFILVFCCPMTAFASDNKLIAIKAMPLPDNRVRLDFRFSEPVKNPPTSFLTKKSARLALDFSDSEHELSSDTAMQSMNLGALLGYKVRNANNHVRVLLDLKSPVFWSGNLTGNQYTLILHGKSAENLATDTAHESRVTKQLFTGKPVSLDFQKIKVSAVLQLLADVAGINIVVGSAVGNEEIALHLKEVPWDQALDIILTTQNLGKRAHGNIIFVDSVQNITVKAIEALKNKQEVSKQEPLRADLIQINYAKASEIAVMLKDKDNSLLSSRGVVSVDVRTNSLWIQDTARQIAIIQALIGKLDVPVRQVSIESRIVTVDKDFSHDLGIHWDISKANTGDTNPLQNATPLLPFVDRLNLDLAALPMGATPASVGIALARLGEGILLDLELSALESESRGEVIASPRLITANQQAATIESGTEIPYQEATASGATAVSFKKAVLSLSVTPQITPDNKIMMMLKINQDRPGVVTNGVPAINTKQIQTNVLVNNGQTIVLGGIYQQDKKNVLSRVPFLGDLPLVGSLFRSTKVSMRNEELLIFITPKIITNAFSTTVERQK